MNDSTFVARSRAAFVENFPHVAARLEQGSAVQSSVVIEDGTPVDIRVEGQLIYGGDARRFAAGQVAAYMEKPLRFFVQRLDLSGIVTPVGTRLMHAFDKEMRTGNIGASTTQPTDNPTFLIVFGLGLGHHLKDLVERTKPRWLILLEPLVDFFEHSFHVVDWGDLIEGLQSNGGSAHIITESDPLEMARLIGSFVSAKGMTYADGSWVFTHYPLWAFTEARDHLHEALEFVFINRGYYEDELVMMQNAVENYAKHDCWLIEGRPRLRRTEAAIIVGSGPSLDESLDTIKRIREQVVLFSAGSALRPLLLNGIVPDFHCELENSAAVYDVLREAGKHGDLSKITLIASSTVHPTVPSLFDDRIFYFRDSVSPTQILGRKHRDIVGTAPTCVNLALTVAATMGFTDFFLFGTDCGSRPDRSRHAKGTIYSDVALYKAGNQKANAMEVAGNFGGVVNTEIVYDLCRIMLGQTIRFYGLRVINCSDGAVIGGARPCVPEAVEVGTAAVDRARLQAELRATMQRYAAGKVLEEADLVTIRRQTTEMFEALDQLLNELSEGKADFGMAFDRLRAFVGDAKDRYGYTESIISGSLLALPRIAMFYGFRVATAEGRRKLFDVFIAEFRDIAKDMAKNIYGLFDGLESQAPSPVDRLAVNGGD
jgi:hypothetical protein